MRIERIVSRSDCRREVLSEDCFESFYDKYETFFKFGVKFHSDELFLEGVSHYVVMCLACLHRDIVTDVVDCRFILWGIQFCRLMRPTAVRGFGAIWVEHEFVSHNKHDENQEDSEDDFEHVN